MENLRALDKTLTDLRSYIDVAKREIGPYRHYGQDEADPKAHVAVLGEPLLRPRQLSNSFAPSVAGKKIAAEAAAEQVAHRSICLYLEESRSAKPSKAAFEAGDDVLDKIKPFLKGAVQNRQQSSSESEKRSPLLRKVCYYPLSK